MPCLFSETQISDTIFDLTKANLLRRHMLI